MGPVIASKAQGIEYRVETQRHRVFSGGFLPHNYHFEWHFPSGCWFQPLRKMMEFVRWDDDIPYIVENYKNSCSKPPTSNVYVNIMGIFVSLLL
jgi:hypothetical protein